MTTHDKLGLMKAIDSRNAERIREHSARQVRATFANGRSAIYTEQILHLLMTDPQIIEIMDCQTGELLYTA